MFDLSELIRTAGYFGVFAILFAETGLFIGFFLPGDSLLFTAGFLASQHLLNIELLGLAAFAGAILGNTVGYWFGARIGPYIFSRENSLIFSRKNVMRSQAFYERHGGKALIFARFIPVVRTFVPILAGVGKMNIRKFQIYNLAGGLLWTWGLIFLGYFLGRSIPNVDRYLLPIVLLIILTSVLPGVVHVLRSAEDREKLWAFLKKLLGQKTS